MTKSTDTAATARAKMEAAVEIAIHCRGCGVSFSGHTPEQVIDEALQDEWKADGEGNAYCAKCEMWE